VGSRERVGSRETLKLLDYVQENKKTKKQKNKKTKKQKKQNTNKIKQVKNYNHIIQN
jgi:hypothetical protein